MKLSKGEIAGIVLACAAVLAGVFLAVYFGYWRYLNYGDSIVLTLQAPRYANDRQRARKQVGSDPASETVTRFVTLNGGGAFIVQESQPLATSFILTRPDGVTGDFATNKPFLLQAADSRLWVGDIGTSPHYRLSGATARTGANQLRFVPVASKPSTDQSRILASGTSQWLNHATGPISGVNDWVQHVVGSNPAASTVFQMAIVNQQSGAPAVDDITFPFQVTRSSIQLF
jgi:hypothetical protein